MVRAKVKYTREHIMALYRIAGKPHMIKKVIISCMFLLYGAAVLLYAVRSYGFTGQSQGVVLAFGVLICAYYFQDLKKNLRLKEHYETMHIADASLDLSFGEDTLSNVKTAKDHTVHKIFPYRSLFRAVETMNYFFIYKNKSKIFIIHKSDITEGTPEELEKLLAEKFGRRFRNKRSADI